MSIRTAKFYVYRDETPSCCRGEELKFKLKDQDILVVQRGASFKKFTISLDSNNLPDVSRIRDT